MSSNSGQDPDQTTLSSCQSPFANSCCDTPESSDEGVASGKPCVPESHEISDMELSETAHEEPLSAKAPADGAAMDDSGPPGTQTASMRMAICTETSSLTTFGYQRALRNRIQDQRLAKNGDYDVHKYTPVFVHDCLVLPGALANVLEKNSEADLIHRMTPALLPGFTACATINDAEPCLLRCDASPSYIQGIIIFGQGRSRRRLLHQHYRPHARRVKVEAEVETVIPVPPADRKFAEEHFQLQRRKITAHAWVCFDKSCMSHLEECAAPQWTLEDYLAGTLQVMVSHEEEAVDLEEEPDEGFYIINEAPAAPTVEHQGCGSLDNEQSEESLSGC